MNQKRKTPYFLDIFIPLVYSGLFLWALFFILPVAWFSYSDTKTVLATWFRTDEFGSASTVTKGMGVSHYRIQYQLERIRYRYEYNGQEYSTDTVPGPLTGLFLPTPAPSPRENVEIRVSRVAPQSSTLQAQFKANLLIGGVLISLTLVLIFIHRIIKRKKIVVNW